MKICVQTRDNQTNLMFM